MNTRVWLPIVLFGYAGLAGFVANQQALRRSTDRDSGSYWAQVVWRICIWLGLPLLGSTLIESFSATWWRSGWHLLFDRVVGYWWSFPAACILPFAVWTLFLFIGSRRTQGNRTRRAWLAGTAGFGTSRKWVLHCIWLLVIPLVWLAQEGLSYPAVAWGTAAVLVISLLGMAFSAGTRPVALSSPAISPEDAARVPLKPWPEAMQSGGIDLEHVFTCNATQSPHLGADSTVVSGNAAAFAERLRASGAQGVNPKIAELVRDMLSSMTGESNDARTCLLIAPDDSGQIEAVALAGHDIAVLFNEITLIVCPPNDQTIIDQLRHWTSQIGQVFQREIEVLHILPGTDLRAPAGIWVVDAATLSEYFISQITEPGLADRIGLVVWWNVHSYSGVLAANVWAISRRLHRIMQEHGSHDICTLVTIRYAFYSADLPAFVRHLLPYSFQRETYVERSFPRTMQMYRLENQSRFLAKHRAAQFAIRCRHLPLVAAYVSADQGWPTRLEPAPDIPQDERRQVLDMPFRKGRLGEWLVDNRTEAGAEILTFEAANALPLLEVLSQGGRAAMPELPHHVGIAVSENPYLDYLLDRLRQESSMPGSRRLIVAEANEAISRRHLFLALAELEDTRTGLLHSFRWDKRGIQDTLDEISKHNRLDRRPVRYLDEHNKLVPEYSYKSRLMVNDPKRPLDTIGEQPIFVRDVDAPIEEGGIRMQVDRERRIIQAYPERIFLSGGLRYRIRDWNDDDEWITCVREDQHAATWRIRRSLVVAKAQTAPAIEFGESELRLRAYPVSAGYRESFQGVVRRVHDLSSGAIDETRIMYKQSLSTSFDTQALLLQFHPQADDTALRALCLALRCILPVHLGVEEDALELVPLTGQTVFEQKVDGVAIVDLYPRGIGLIEAMFEQQLVKDILERTRQWMAAVIQNKETSGADRILVSPLAASSRRGEDLGAALVLLQRLSGLAARSYIG